MTIRTMLLAVVAVLFLTACGQGAFSLYVLRQVNDGLATFSLARLPHANALGRMRDQFANLRLAEGVMIAALDEETKGLADRQTEAAMAGVEAELKALRSLSGPAETPALDAFATILTRYADAHARVRQLIQSRDFDLATGFYVTELGAIYAAGATALSGMADRGQALARTEASNFAADYERAWTGIVLATAFSILFGVAAALVIVRLVSIPMLRMADAMKRIAGGGFDAEVPAVQRPLELSGMAKALRICRDELRQADAIRRRQAVMDGEAAESLRRERRRMADEFGAAMDSFATEFLALADQVAAAAKDLNVTADGASSKSETVTQSAEHAASNVRAMATAAERLAASVRDIDQRTSYSSDLATRTAEHARSTETAIQHLSDQAARIEEVIDLISAIASQTNLLALNATIEAARAGHAGRAFAVVAAEVKTLAAQTSQATGEISARIRQVQDATRDAVEKIYEIVSEVVAVREVSQGIALSVRQQGLATADIATGAVEAASATGRVTENMAEVSRAATRTGEAAQMLLALASSLQGRSIRATEAVDMLVRQMKAA